MLYARLWYRILSLILHQDKSSYVDLFDNLHIKTVVLKEGLELIIQSCFYNVQA